MKPQEQEDPAKGGEDWRGRFHEHFDEWMSVPEMHLLEDFIETEIERAKAEGVRLGRIEEASRCVEWAGKKIRTLDLNMEEIKHETN